NRTVMIKLFLVLFAGLVLSFCVNFTVIVTRILMVTGVGLSFLPLGTGLTFLPLMLPPVDVARARSDLFRGLSSGSRPRQHVGRLRGISATADAPCQWRHARCAAGHRPCVHGMPG